MSSHNQQTNGREASLNRRKLLEFLSASPILAPGAISAVAGMLAAGTSGAMAQSYDVLRQAPVMDGDLIANPAQALNVFDFEAVAKKTLPPAHYGYLASGVDGDETLKANREGFEKIAIRARRLIDVRKIDTTVKIFGETWGSPIALAPISSQGAFHPEAEGAVARACKAKNHQMILSTVGSTSIEDVIKERGSPVWYMLYPTDDWAVTEALVKRAEKAGAPAIVLTVDRQGGRNTETLFRERRSDTRTCTDCHTPGFKNEVSRKPMFDDLDVSKVTNLYGTGMTWDYVKRLRGIVKGKLVLKGIVTHEDAKKAMEYGVDALIVSNHGGRAEESLQSTIGVLPEIVSAVNGKVPILIDGGFRRGTDVIKALALGATAVCVGRPYAWGLAAFGQPGVEMVLTLMQREFETIMRQVGATKIAEINAASVSRA
ncbi:MULTISPECIES: alpha-hydroxy acid oxidase [unclassified Methylobacterium]|uniref:alpha-hydroxy acid oxidase n=1 Tax=unclassified Methylobacterium TaxID=2615210 RepID=UPI0006F791D4|nr:MULTISPECIES: alpha-hydroxy acid oxidase [unclassified Methylobacterium]KQO71284.1 alpha-hydroxy-acid oxidizing enzyme [Methylobacterium sp. Leaf87]KQP60426.1 alpha-hydroxy-acid oxidizing enzyme [Methylobacterium sp. Leaf112]